jgi:hypothetical protein
MLLKVSFEFIAYSFLHFITFLSLFLKNIITTTNHILLYHFTFIKAKFVKHFYFSLLTSKL